MMRRNAVGLRYPEVVGAKGGRDVHDAGAVFGGHEVAENHAEGRVPRPSSDVGRTALVVDAFEVCAVELGQFQAPGQQLFVACRHSLPNRRLCSFFGEEILPTRSLASTTLDGRVGVGVERADQHDTECSCLRPGAVVGGQRPGRCRPGQDANVFFSLNAFKQRLRVSGRFHLELRHDGRVLHVSVGAGLVQLVRRQARAGRRRIRLDGVAFVEQTLVVELLEQRPAALDVLRSRR